MYVRRLLHAALGTPPSAGPSSRPACRRPAGGWGAVYVTAYLALFGLLAASWAGFPAAGQAALVAAGVLAAKERQTLEIEVVLLVGTAASFTGGVIGYWLGRKGGRAAWTSRGPLRGRRHEILEHGERLIARHGHFAVLLAPMWVAGILGMRWRAFLLWSLLASVI